MNVFVSVSGRCVRTWPPEACLVALISGYFDDSQSTGDVWVVAGYVGYANQWEHLGRMWDEALRAHDVPYFHKREMADPAGAFAKWLPPEDHQEEVVAFFKDLVGAIRRCGVHIITSAVWVKDLERFNSEKGLILEPYPLAAYSCMSQIALKHGDVPVTAVFDRVEKVDDKLRKARLYADTDRHAYPGLCNLVTSIPLEAGLTSRTVPALQAADLIAWEVRKALFKMKPWQLSDRPLAAREEQWQHYLEWTRESSGQDPFLRKSLDALISEVSFNSIVWDYQQISTTHDARRGIWTEAVAEQQA